MTRCGVPLIGENGARTALDLTDVTCTECRELLAIEERHAAGVAQLRAEIRRPAFPDEVLLPISAESRLAVEEEFSTEQAEAVIEEWTPGPELAAAVEADRAALPALAAAVIDGSTPRNTYGPQRLWVHSGPCIYCSHGPACVACDLTQGPHWGAAGHDYPGPVCGRCSEECKRREIAADPYYSGDYVAMFGDDE